MYYALCSTLEKTKASQRCTCLPMEWERKNGHDPGCAAGRVPQPPQSSTAGCLISSCFIHDVGVTSHETCSSSILVHWPCRQSLHETRCLFARQKSMSLSTAKDVCSIPWNGVHVPALPITGLLDRMNKWIPPRRWCFLPSYLSDRQIGGVGAI